MSTVRKPRKNKTVSPKSKNTKNTLDLDTEEIQPIIENKVKTIVDSIEKKTEIINHENIKIIYPDVKNVENIVKKELSPSNHLQQVVTLRLSTKYGIDIFSIKVIHHYNIYFNILSECDFTIKLNYLYDEESFHIKDIINKIENTIVSKNKDVYFTEMNSSLCNPLFTLIENAYKEKYHDTIENHPTFQKYHALCYKIKSAEKYTMSISKYFTVDMLHQLSLLNVCKFWDNVYEKVDTEQSHLIEESVIKSLEEIIGIYRNIEKEHNEKIELIKEEELKVINERKMKQEQEDIRQQIETEKIKMMKREKETRDLREGEEKLRKEEEEKLKELILKREQEQLEREKSLRQEELQRSREEKKAKVLADYQRKKAEELSLREKENIQNAPQPPKVVSVDKETQRLAKLREAQLKRAEILEKLSKQTVEDKPLKIKKKDGIFLVEGHNLIFDPKNKVITGVLRDGMSIPLNDNDKTLCDMMKLLY